MTGPVRVALVGYGLGGRVFHAPFLSALPQLSLVSVVTANPERAAQVASDHPSARVLPDVDALVAAGPEHDLAVVTTTNATHVPIARTLAAAGLAVVVDKPLAPSATEARRLADDAEREGWRVTAFHNRRWDSDQETLHRLLRDGLLGEVLRYESRFERWRPQLGAGRWRESAPAAEGGGILLDLGTHLVDQAVTLFGPVREVYAELHARRGGADDDAFLALSHETGVHSHLSATALAGQAGPRLRVLGSQAAFVVDALDGQEAALRARRTPADAAWGEEPEERWGRLVRGDSAVPVPAARGRWDEFWRAVPAWVHGAGSAPVDLADVVHVADVLDAARRSAARRVVVRVRPGRGG